MRKIIQDILLISFLIFGFAPAYSQNKKKIISHKAENIKKTDTLFTTTLGDVPGNQSLPASFVKSLLNKPLVVYNQEHQAFRVVSFSFGYQTNGSYDNDTTGMPEKTSSYISYPFYSDRLDSLWRTRIGNELRPGDQLYFDHIIVQGKNGIYHLAVPLRFTIR